MGLISPTSRSVPVNLDFSNFAVGVVYLGIEQIWIVR